MKFIFQVVIKEGRTLDEYVEAWQRASVIIQGMPGARGTRLHRAIGSSRSLLAIAEWDSKEERDQAMAHLRQDPAKSSTLADTVKSVISPWSASLTRQSGRWSQTLRLEKSRPGDGQCHGGAQAEEAFLPCLRAHIPHRRKRGDVFGIAWTSATG